MNGRRRLLVVFLATLLLSTASAPVLAGGAGTAPTGSNATAPTGTSTEPVELHRSQELALTPDRPGEIRVQVSFEIPSAIDNLRTRLSDRAITTSVDGFLVDDGAYVWDRRTTAPTITYRLLVNETTTESGPIARDGIYQFVDAGPWALVRRPSVTSEWNHSREAEVELTETTTVDGQGAVGDSLVFLGPYVETRRQAHGQTFRLIVPDAATLAEPPWEILAELTAAADALRVGARADTVFVVAAPTESVEWGIHGLQVGQSDLWVQDEAELDTVGNTWIHEYVHTRQDYRTTNATRWFTEASASYYAALLALERGRIDFEQYRDRLVQGLREPYARTILSDPETWARGTPYRKGGLVAAALDRRLRTATERQRSFQTVFARLNGYGDRVDEAALTEIVRDVGGERTAALARRYVGTTVAPSVWNRSVHRSTFVPTPARIGYTVPSGGERYAVSGPYRASVADADGPVTLAVGETLSVEARVHNAGETAGPYTTRFAVDGEYDPDAWRRLAPNVSRPVTLAHRFEQPGEYTVSAGGASRTVRVREPTTPTVTSVDVTASNGTIRVRATVRNDGSVPAAGNVSLFLNGATVQRRAVTLPPEGERVLSYALTDLEPGEHDLRVGEFSRTVAVDRPTDRRVWLWIASVVGLLGVAGALLHRRRT